MSLYAPCWGCVALLTGTAACCQAQRKAPQKSALGFRLAVHRLGTIVQLLLGEIPDRAIFRAPASRKPMRPYLKLVQARVSANCFVTLGELSC